MNTPESGMCSLEEYNRGKQFIVAPERLCAEGIYTFACRARPKLDWQACLFTVKLEGVQRTQDDSNPYLVSLAYEELDAPRRFTQALSYPSDSQGRIAPFGIRVFEEAYLRHRFDDTDAKLNNIEQLEGVEPPRVATVPFAIPIGA